MGCFGNVSKLVKHVLDLSSAASVICTKPHRLVRLSGKLNSRLACPARIGQDFMWRRLHKVQNNEDKHIMCDSVSHKHTLPLVTTTNTSDREFYGAQAACCQHDDLLAPPPPAKFIRRKATAECGPRQQEHRVSDAALLHHTKKDIYENIILREICRTATRPELDDLWDSTHHAFWQ